MIEYYKTLINQTNNPIHLAYYKKMLDEFSGKKTKSNYTERYLFKININKVYSPVLKKHFRTMADASRYVNKGRSYARRCIIGELDNKYKFKIL